MPPKTIDLDALLNDLDDFLDKVPEPQPAVSADDDSYEFDLDDYADEEVPASVTALPPVVPKPVPAPTTVAPRPPTNVASPRIPVMPLSPAPVREQMQRLPQNMNMPPSPVTMRQNMPPHQYGPTSPQNPSSPTDFRRPSVLSAFPSPNQPPMNPYAFRSPASPTPSRQNMYPQPMNTGSPQQQPPMSSQMGRTRSEYSNHSDTSSYRRGSLMQGQSYEGVPQPQQQQYQPMERSYSRQGPSESEVLRMELERTKMELKDRLQMNQILMAKQQELIEQQQRQVEEEAVAKEQEEVRLLREELEKARLELTDRMQMSQNLMAQQKQQVVPADASPQHTTPTSTPVITSEATPKPASPIPNPVSLPTSESKADTVSIASKVSTGSKPAKSGGSGWFGRSKSVSSIDKKKSDAGSLKEKKKEKVELEALLRDLDTTLGGFKPGSDTDAVTVDALMQSSNGIISGVIELASIHSASHPDTIPWTKRFVILSRTALHVFGSSDPSESILAELRITPRTETFERIPNTPLGFEVSGPGRESWIFKAQTKTAKNTWIEQINYAIKTQGSTGSTDELYEYLDEYAGTSPTSTPPQVLHAQFARMQRQLSRGAGAQPINITRLQSTSSSNAASLQESPSSPALYDFLERRESASTFESSGRPNRRSSLSMGQPLSGGIPGGGVFGSSFGETPAPDMVRNASRKKSAKAQMSMTFVQF
ncbi:hypothetical protein HDU98_006825 [Podochytrium sp. JEL0797]|nr:hypothetical protein HDU98_006825 [Podochytrium sp. JEL0797]